MDDIYTLENIKITDQTQTMRIEIDLQKMESKCGLSDLPDILRMVANECEKKTKEKGKKS